MHVDFVDFKDCVQEHSGRILFFVGVILLVVGVFFLRTLGGELSAASLFLGIVFCAFGILARLGFFSVNLRSWGGLGTISICVAIAFFAFSISIFQFLNLKLVGIMPAAERGQMLPYFRFLFHSERSYLWLTNLLLRLSLVFLIVGAAVRVYSLR